MDEDLRFIQEVRDLLERAASAQARLAGFDQAAIDRIVDAVAAAAEREARSLAALAVEETGYGNVPDKTAKNLFAARTIYQYIRPLKTVGVLREDLERGLVEIACPKGIVAAIIPSTNPTSTTIYKTLIALKAGCGIVLSPHPSALRCIRASAEVCDAAARAAGAPDGILGCMTFPNERSTAELMKHRRTGVILATGGLGLVRAAYSAGKPAYGVGPGNVPAFIERSADVAKAVRDIVTGTTFDYGTICSSEQAIVVDRPVLEQVKAELRRRKAHLLSREEIAKLGPIIITPDRRVSPKVVGRAAPVIARLAGIRVPDDTTVLVAELERVGHDEPLSLEKLSPVLALYVADGWEAGCERCVEILSHGGLGHTMSIHSTDDRIIREFGMKKPVFRIVVNSPTTHGAIGFSTGVAPSMTLGCGSLGGNITSDNVTPLHLIDVKRLAYEVRSVEPGAPVPGWPVGSGRRPFVRPLSVEARPLPEAAPAPLPEPAPVPSSPSASGPARARSRAAVERVVADFLAARGAAPPRGVEAAGSGHGGVSGGARPVPPGPAPAPPPAPTPPAAPVAVAAAASVPSARFVDVVDERRPVEFVCEDDVRKALRDGREILVGPRTIVTPSARDLGQANRIFRKIG